MSPPASVHYKIFFPDNFRVGLCDGNSADFLFLGFGGLACLLVCLFGFVLVLAIVIGGGEVGVVVRVVGVWLW